MIQRLNGTTAIVARELRASLGVGAVAVGGSHGKKQSSDMLSDVDLFVFCEDHEVGQAISSVESVLMKTLSANGLVSQAILSRRFGIKICALTTSGPWVECYLNAPSFFERLPMVSNMVFIDDSSAAFFSRHFFDVADVATGSDPQMLIAIATDAALQLRGAAKSQLRGDSCGVRFFVSRLKTICAAVEMEVIGERDYDPHYVERGGTGFGGNFRLWWESVFSEGYCDLREISKRLLRQLIKLGIEKENTDVVLAILERAVDPR